MKNKKISIVAPVYNEQDSIAAFYERTVGVVGTITENYELIFVNDGSTDRSMEFLERIAQKDKKVKVIAFSRNFGHMCALSAGLDCASGDAVITIDTDLQHPPEVIPKLLEKWSAGAEIINTIRKESYKIGKFKEISSMFFYWLMNRITKINFQSNSADFRLLDRSVVETIKQMKEHTRFLRGIISWVGYKQEFVSYNVEARAFGKTKYSFIRMFSFALDGITSFSAVPLRISTYMGMIIAFFSFVYIVYAVYLRFLNKTVAGWTSVLVVVLFMGGVQLVFLGIIGEYLTRVYDETRNRPLYVIQKKIGF